MNKPIFEEVSSEEHKSLESLVKRIGLEETLVYIFYTVANQPKIKTDSLSSYLLLEMFNRSDILKYIKESSEEFSEEEV